MKVKFAQVGDASQSQLCDNFLAYAELLRILMVNKCERQHLVSLEELATTDKARRLRDALIEDNQFSLAMEVATKCQVSRVIDVKRAWSFLEPLRSQASPRFIGLTLEFFCSCFLRVMFPTTCSWKPAMCGRPGAWHSYGGEISRLPVKS